MHLSHVDGTAGENIALLDQIQQKIAPAAPVVEGVYDDACVEEAGSHLARVGLT